MPWLGYCNSLSFNYPLRPPSIVVSYCGKVLCGNTLRKVIQKISEYRWPERHLWYKMFTYCCFHSHCKSQTIGVPTSFPKGRVLKITFSLCLRTMLTNSSWLFCYLINFLEVLWQKILKKCITITFPDNFTFLQGFICILFSHSQVLWVHFIIPYVKTIKINKIHTRAFLCQQSTNQSIYETVFMQNHHLLKRSQVCSLLFMQQVCQGPCRSN